MLQLLSNTPPPAAAVPLAPGSPPKAPTPADGP
jgi:hypothetical protein